jgi:hypothetical protein
MLLFVYSKGCPACAHAKPEFEKFKARNPMQMALEIDADGPYPPQFGLPRIRATPLYVLKLGEIGVTHEGAMKAEQIEKWVKAAQAAEG